MAGKRRWPRRVAISVAALLILAALLAWLRMGGVVVETGNEGYADVVQGGPAVFTVVAYNVQARPYFDDSKHKFTYISPVLNPYDIVGIQECFKDYRRLWDGTAHPVKIYHSRLKAPWKIVGSGLSVLGRFPLKSVEAVNFKAVGEMQNKPASKGMVLARFDVGGMPLDFYTTHMEAGRSPEAMWSRRKQGEELVQFVRSHSQPEHAVIFAGDFNMRPTREGDARLEGYVPGQGEPDFDAMSREQIFDAILMELGFTSASVALGIDDYRGVDHVLYRSGKGLELTALSWQHDDEAFYDPAGKPLSDHEPMIVRFRLERAS